MTFRHDVCKSLILWWALQDSNLRLPPCEVRSRGILLTAKDLKTGGVGKTGPIGAICHKNATNFFQA